MTISSEKHSKVLSAAAAPKSRADAVVSGEAAVVDGSLACFTGLAMVFIAFMLADVGSSACQRARHGVYALPWLCTATLHAAASLQRTMLQHGVTGKQKVPGPGLGPPHRAVTPHMRTYESFMSVQHV